MKYSNEIQLEIDDVYACPGHCPGCVLSSIERKTREPDLDFNILKTAITKLIEYVPTLSNLEKINLTYGIGDHFLMSNEYLEKTYHLGADLIEKTNLKNEYNGIFYTASMIGKFEIISPKIDHLAKISKTRGVPFYIIAVLDPKQLYNKNFANVYKKNIIYANEVTGKVDLAINLSEEAIDKISPQELYDFAKMNHFDEVTINWTPTDDNLNYVYFNQKKLVKWLIEFDSIIAERKDLDTSYRPVILKTLHNIMCGANEWNNELNLDFNLSIKNNLDELVQKSLQIDHKGNIFPKYEAIGDIAHTPRIGIKAWGNVTENKSIREIVINSRKQTISTIQKQFLKKPCMNCEYRSLCANSGFHVYNHILNDSSSQTFKEKIAENIRENDCPHSAKSLFNHYLRQIPEFNKKNLTR